MDAVDERWEGMRGRWIPLVRRVTDPDAAARASALGRPFPHVALTPFLDGRLGLPSADGVALIGPDRRADLGMDPAELWSAALAGLEPTTSVEVAPGLLRITARDGQAASRLALPGWLDAHADRVDGRPVAVAPTPDAVFVTGEQRIPHEELTALITLAGRLVASAGRSLAAMVVVGTPTGFAAWSPPDGHPAAPAQREAVAALAVGEYDRQRHALEGSSTLPLARPVRISGGRTVARWDGGPCWLPEVDHVVFADAFVIPLARLAPWLRVLPVRPVRYEVISRPTVEELQRVGAVALSANG